MNFIENGGDLEDFFEDPTGGPQRIVLARAIEKPEDMSESDYVGYLNRMKDPMNVVLNTNPDINLIARNGKEELRSGDRSDAHTSEFIYAKADHPLSDHYGDVTFSRKWFDSVSAYVNSGNVILILAPNLKCAKFFGERNAGQAAARKIFGPGVDSLNTAQRVAIGGTLIAGVVAAESYELIPPAVGEAVALIDVSRTGAAGRTLIKGVSKELPDEITDALVRSGVARHLADEVGDGIRRDISVIADDADLLRRMRTVAPSATLDDIVRAREEAVLITKRFMLDDLNRIDGKLEPVGAVRVRGAHPDADVVSPYYDKINSGNAEKVFTNRLGKNTFGTKAVVHLNSDGKYKVLFQTESRITHHRNGLETLVGGDVGRKIGGGDIAPPDIEVRDVLKRSWGFQLRYDPNTGKITQISSSSQITEFWQPTLDISFSREQIDKMERALFDAIDSRLLDDAYTNIPRNRWLDKRGLRINDPIFEQRRAIELLPTKALDVNDVDYVSRLTQQMQEAGQFTGDPVRVFHHEGKTYIIDGHLRWHAALDAEISDVPIIELLEPHLIIFDMSVDRLSGSSIGALESMVN